MVQVVALTGGKNDPAARFRVRQHVGLLAERGYEVTEIYSMPPRHVEPPIFARADKAQALWRYTKAVSSIRALVGSRHGSITWLQRELCANWFSLEGMLSHPIVFDVDDAIWLQSWVPASAMRLHALNADVVLAGNSYIAEWFSQYTARVEIVPTAIDCTRFALADGNVDRDRFVIGWTGSHWTVGYLKGIEAPLCQFMRDHPNVDLHVVCDKQPELPSLPVERVKFIRWSESVEASAVQGMDLGIMPLPDNEWTRGKCSYKMLQYMACGVPVVVSPVGLNDDILRIGECGLGATCPTEWYAAFDAIYKDRVLARRWGNCGRSIVETRFSTEVVAGQIGDTFSRLL